MDCLIRVIDGPDKGAEAVLPPGTSLVGRSPRAALRLTAPDISHEHLLITRSGDDYFIENLSARGTFIDGSKITGQVRLRPRQQVRLSEQTVLRLEPLGGAGVWARWKLVIVATALALAAAAVFALTRSSAPRRAETDWAGAFAAIDRWVRDHSQRGPLPPETPALLAEAWRLEQAGDYARSQKLWLKLLLVIDSVEDRLRMKASSVDNPAALQQLLTPGPDDAPPGDAELAAATVQFVNRRLTWASRQAQQPSSGWFR